jgi:hypothetical protein
MVASFPVEKIEAEIRRPVEINTTRGLEYFATP